MCVFPGLWLSIAQILLILSWGSTTSQTFCFVFPASAVFSCTLSELFPLSCVHCDLCGLICCFLVFFLWLCVVESIHIFGLSVSSNLNLAFTCSALINCEYKQQLIESYSKQATILLFRCSKFGWAQNKQYYPQKERKRFADVKSQ